MSGAPLTINPLQAAFHEAGHVVIARAHGIGCEEVAILRAGERPSKGHEDYRGWVHYQLEAGDRNRTTNFVAGAIAGPIATFLYKGRTASGRTKLRRTLKTVPLVRVKYSNHPRDVYESTIEGNFFGVFLSNASGVEIVGNRVVASHVYGIDPFGRSSGVLIERNTVVRSGRHGIVLRHPELVGDRRDCGERCG